MGLLYRSARCASGYAVMCVRRGGRSCAAAFFRVIGNSLWFPIIKKNVPWHILAPSAVACDNLHLCASAHHRRVSAFLCNREFLGISYYIKKTDILPQQDVWPSSWARRTRTFKCRSQNPVPCQFGDSPMSLDKKNYITGKQKRQALFLNFLNFFIYLICRQ